MYFAQTGILAINSSVLDVLISRLSLYYSLKKYDLRMCLLTNGCTNLGFNGANVCVERVSDL